MSEGTVMSVAIEAVPRNRAKLCAKQRERLMIN